MTKNYDMEVIWGLLEQINDPEIPVVSIVDLGLIRNVGIDAGKVIVTFAPTFLGCPALDVIQQDILKKLQESGIEQVQVKVTLSPPWSSNWITNRGRKRLKEFGLSPPPQSKDMSEVISEAVCCPYCDSEQTVLKNYFGPTLCRSIYYCNNCNQPFEQFKPI